MSCRLSLIHWKPALLEPPLAQTAASSLQFRVRGTDGPLCGTTEGTDSGVQDLGQFPPPWPPPLTPAGSPTGDPNRYHSAATSGTLRWAEKRGFGGVDSKKIIGCKKFIVIFSLFSPAPISNVNLRWSIWSPLSDTYPENQKEEESKGWTLPRSPQKAVGVSGVLAPLLPGWKRSHQLLEDPAQRAAIRPACGHWPSRLCYWRLATPHSMQKVFKELRTVASHRRLKSAIGAGRERPAFPGQEVPE